MKVKTRDVTVCDRDAISAHEQKCLQQPLNLIKVKHDVGLANWVIHRSLRGHAGHRQAG